MLFLALAVLFPLLPQSERVALTCAGTTETSAKDEVYRCDKNPIAERDDLRVEADWLEYDPKTNLITAGDHVKFTRLAAGQPAEEVTGSKLSFNIETKSGTVTNVRGQAEGYYFKADEYERLPDGTWKLKHLYLTACPGDCPDWGFRINQATVVPGKEFAVSSSTFRVRNFPILRLPPVKRKVQRGDRQSGFMMPGYSKSRLKGTSLREGYYWVLGRSADVTFTGEYFTLRGPAGLIDFTSRPNATTYIDVSEFFVFDRKHQGGQRTEINFLSDINENWRAIAKVNITSDFDFRQVFENGFNVISSPIEESLAFATRNGRRSSFNVLYDRSAVFYPEQSVALRKFPSIDYQLPTNLLGGPIPVYFSLDAGYDGMSRRDDRIVSPAFLQRVDLHPSFEIPVLRSNWLSWSNRFGVRETFYTHSLNPDVQQRTLNRGTFDYTLSMTGPQIEKNFGHWKHVIEPTLTYRYIAGADRFRQTIMVDETDLLTDTNEIEYGLTNRFFNQWERLTWRVAQKMYFDETFGNALLSGRRNTLDPVMDLTGFAFSDGVPRRFSPIVSTVRLATTPNTSTDVEVDYDTTRHEFRSAGIMGDLNRGIVRSSIGYFFNKKTEIQSANNQLRAFAAVGTQYKPGFSAGFGFSYDLYRRIFQGSTGQVYYNAQCFGLSFEVSQVDLGARRDFGWRVSFQLKNLGTFGNLRPQERLF